MGLEHHHETLTFAAMTRPFFSIRLVLRILTAVGIVVAFNALLILLRSYLSPSVIALLYLIPVGFCAALLGRMAGISASILSFLAFNYFFISPFYTLRVAHPQDFLELMVFLGVAVVISSLMARIQNNLDQVRAREHEAIQLYELSIDLAGKNNQEEIARSLAERLARLMPQAVLEVEIDPIRQCIRIPEHASQDLLQAPDLALELPSPNGQLGRIRIWHPGITLQPDELRLVQTFASQGALALDRANLSANQTRAKILEESDRLKTAILSSVSHELRTPLASIQAAATSLFNPAVELGPEAREELQSLLVEETENMAQLVGNLLNMSRIEAGALKLQRQWNAIAEIIDTALQRLHRVTANHQIDVDVSEDLPLISIDSILIEQVVINLIRNSIKFSPLHSIIHISAQENDKALIITISNQGPPIPDPYIEHIFEKFYPIPSKDQLQGTGLGLSICQGIVEAHGGKIWAANLPAGVAFHIRLPRTDTHVPSRVIEEVNEIP